MLVLSCGVDYLTVTAKPGTDEEKYLMSVFEEWYPLMIALGHGQKGHKVMQYLGTKYGPLFYGTSTQGAMMRVSGGDASDMMDHFIKRGQLPHFTRIDVQVTVQFDKAEVNHAEMQAAQAKARQLSNPRKGAQPKVRCEKTFGDGDTLYIGKRTSETFCRCYDKGAETGDYPVGLVWRYEVEWKGDKADEAAAYVSHCRNEVQALQDLVSSTYEQRQVSVPFEAVTAPSIVSMRKERTDVDKKLEWLRRSVAPALAEVVKAGRISDLKSALGFDTYGII